MKCYLCGNEDHDLVGDKLRYESKSAVYRCKKCNLVFLYPSMSLEEEKDFYEREYGEIYSKEKGTTPADLFKSRQGDAKLYYQLVKEYLKTDMDCLEMGCASGYFLAEIRDKVCSICGIESHLLLRDYCESIGIKMFNNLDECPDAGFDMVFLFFVLEHLGDPVLYLNKINKILRKGGKIIVVIPNVDDALLSLYDIPAFRIYYYTPAHQFYYSKETLDKLLRKAGYNNFKISIIQRYDLSNHMCWMMHGKPGGVGKFNNVLGGKLNDEYMLDLIKAGKGDTLIAVINKYERI